MLEPIPENGTTYTSSRIAQLNVGELEIHTMAYPSSKGTRYSYSIELRSLKAAPIEGWGKKIFEGALEDLINLVLSTKKEKV